MPLTLRPRCRRLAGHQHSEADSEHGAVRDAGRDAVERVWQHLDQHLRKRDLISAQISLEHGELARTLAAHLPEMQARLGGNQPMDVRIDMNGQATGQGTGTSAGMSNGSADPSRSGRQQTGNTTSSQSGNGVAEQGISIAAAGLPGGRLMPVSTSGFRCDQRITKLRRSDHAQGFSELHDADDLSTLKPAASSGLRKAISGKASHRPYHGRRHPAAIRPDGLSTTFLSLLATELQNQDPTAPVDSTAMVGQMISLNQLDQLISINQTLTGSTGTATTGSLQPAGATASDAALSSPMAASPACFTFGRGCGRQPTAV